MPRYLARFKVETCLTQEKDLTLEFAEHQHVLLFSKKAPDDGYVIAQIELEAPDNVGAWGKAASGLLPPILDAMSFATGTPLLLRDCELILKAEAGSAKRRALYIGHRHVPSLAPLRTVEIEEVKTILSAGEDLRLPLCWHRYALDRQLALEQFVFNWLAFEALAGDTDVPSRCPKCQEELKHCGSPVIHRSSSKATARQIFKSAHPDTTDQEFNGKIWNKARNYVFHGGRYPDPQYLVELKAHSDKLHTAIDKRIDEVLGLGNRNRPHRGYETWSRRFMYVGWTTKNPSEQFASDWPAKHLANMSEEESANGPAHQAAMADGVTFLDHREFAGW
jgi:hypothetical protein